MGCILNSVTEGKDKCAPETGLRSSPTVQAEKCINSCISETLLTIVLRENTVCFLPPATFSGSHVFPLRGLRDSRGHTFFSSRRPYIALLPIEQSSLQEHDTIHWIRNKNNALQWGSLIRDIHT